MYSIKQIRTSIINALEPLRQTHAVKTIMAYSGQFDDMKDTDSLQRVVMFPALLVAFVSARGTYFDEGGDLPNMRFTVLVASSDPSSHANREDKAIDLLDAVRPILHNNYLGLDLAEPIHVQEEYLVRASKRISIYALESVVNFERPV